MCHFRQGGLKGYLGYDYGVCILIILMLHALHDCHSTHIGAESAGPPRHGGCVDITLVAFRLLLIQPQQLQLLQLPTS